MNSRYQNRKLCNGQVIGDSLESYRRAGALVAADVGVIAEAKVIIEAKIILEPEIIVEHLEKCPSRIQLLLVRNATNAGVLFA
jgi:hypothetical protein